MIGLQWQCILSKIPKICKWVMKGTHCALRYHKAPGSMFRVQFRGPQGPVEHPLTRQPRWTSGGCSPSWPLLCQQHLRNTSTNSSLLFVCLQFLSVILSMECPCVERQVRDQTIPLGHCLMPVIPKLNQSLQLFQKLYQSLQLFQKLN